RIHRIWSHVAIFDHAHRMPLAECNGAVVTAAGRAHRDAFLLSPANLIGESIACAHVIELRCRLVVPGAPGAPSVHADNRALVADEQNNLRIVRVDPDVLVVIATRRAFESGPGFGAIRRAPGHDAGAIDNIRILWIDFRHWEVASTNTQSGSTVRGGTVPALTGIVR